MIEDFILQQDNFFPLEWCDQVIDFIDSMELAGLAQKRQQYQNVAPHTIADTAILMHDITVVRLSNTKEIAGAFTDRFWGQAYPEYANKFSLLKDFASHSIYHLKGQKTRLSEGYHMWHCEDSNYAISGRVLTFILYLNTVEEGGETEFLYLPKRIKAQAGRFILFPGSFTHAHRGNPPLSGTKYVITGWVEF